MKWLLLMTAAILAAGAVRVALNLPPLQLALATSWSDGTVSGIIHVHTNRSDGRSAPAEVAAAAARAGLKFVVFTDHGDATRTPDPPAYRSGVLCLDGVEISTWDGHYIALDMQTSPYPLGGEARDVVEDVKRLGGFGIVAHPDSPERSLQWHDWDAPFDAVEIVNLDTSWRVLAQEAGWSSRLRLLQAFISYPFRPSETIASLLQPHGALSNWEALAGRRRVVMTSGADAHAKLALLAADPGDNRFSLPWPGYRAALGTLSVHVRPSHELSGNAKADAALVMRAIRNGHLYTAIDGVASPALFEFAASNARGTVHAGDELAVGGPVTLHVRSNAPPEFTTTILNGSDVVIEGRHEQELNVVTSDAPAVYRVVITSTGRKGTTTWLASNAIYVRGPEQPMPMPVRPPPTRHEPMFDGRTASAWHLEHDPTSLAALDIVPTVAGAELRLRYALGGGEVSGQFVGLVFDTRSRAVPNGGLTFTARAERPMRLSVQVRTGTDGGGERWQRSVYVDAVNQERTVYFDDLTPLTAPQIERPSFSDIRSILFVIDTTNTPPGASGRLWITSAALQR